MKKLLLGIMTFGIMSLLVLIGSDQEPKYVAKDEHPPPTIIIAAKDEHPPATII
ncbi:hypothetical protein [Thermaerobacillus caldiproteolyticus]|uniref:Uncharacterized protein n=1 Tax=Thermaerobacillus caldiproteolyticus TaxID=247480 RepID=A0A7V9Z4F8_9BACL|nr:hypothetical protein [Anoxybacillus caldiproteolyticus]MBA2873872.1 hypothetical protein [Anoxybacillus caldiproteolyticus]QPA30421.1 hypothetical protein ISX45_12400 [Anoxybacillus caldiproteolyticus]